MAKGPGTSDAKRTVSRFLGSSARKEALGGEAAEDETSSPQRPRISRACKQATAPDVGAASEWQLPFQPSPLANRARKRNSKANSPMGLFSVLPEEVS